MDLLGAAVVDITTLVATCHALSADAANGDPALQRKRRQRLRRELKRGTLAYIDTLARARRAALDDAFLAKCRVAAEQQMAAALRQQGLLGRIMANEAGALAGLAAARQDLWRLAHITVYLRLGVAALRDARNPAAAAAGGAAAARLRRRLRKALIAYARTTLRAKPSGRPPIADARAAAIAEIGKRGAADAERLAAVEAGGNAASTLLGLGVAKPLVDLLLDWPGGEPLPT